MSARTNRTAPVARRRGRAQPAPRRTLRWGIAGGAIVAIVVASIVIALVTRGSGDTSAPVASAPGAVGGALELSQLRTADFHSLVISPADGNVLLYGYHGGILRSTDGARTWQQTNLAGANDDAMGMGASQADPNVVFAAGHGTFFRSSDAGKTWSSIKSGLVGTDVHGLAVAPDVAGTVYANVVGFGLYVSTDSAASWARASTEPILGDVMQITAGPGGRVYAASMSAGVLRSDDGGKTFRALAKSGRTVFSVAAAAADANVVYAGTASGLLVSVDGGTTWTTRTNPGGGQVMVSAVNPRDAKDVTVVAVQADGAGHVFRSRDNGASWTNQ